MKFIKSMGLVITVAGGSLISISSLSGCDNTASLSKNAVTFKEIVVTGARPTDQCAEDTTNLTFRTLLIDTGRTTRGDGGRPSQLIMPGDKLDNVEVLINETTKVGSLVSLTNGTSTDLAEKLSFDTTCSVPFPDGGLPGTCEATDSTVTAATIEIPQFGVTFNQKASREQNMGIAIVIDRSSSLSGFSEMKSSGVSMGTVDGSLLHLAAINAFVNRIPENDDFAIYSMNGSTAAGVVREAPEGENVFLTRNRETVSTALVNSNLKTLEGIAPIWEGIKVAADDMRAAVAQAAASEDAEEIIPAIVVFTDGADPYLWPDSTCTTDAECEAEFVEGAECNQAEGYCWAPQTQTSAATFEEAMAAVEGNANQTAIPVYIIQLRWLEYDVRDARYLKMACETNGSYWFVRDSAGLKGFAFANLHHLLRGSWDVKTNTNGIPANELVAIEGLLTANIDGKSDPFLMDTEQATSSGTSNTNGGIETIDKRPVLGPYQN